MVPFPAHISDILTCSSHTIHFTPSLWVSVVATALEITDGLPKFDSVPSKADLEEIPSESTCCPLWLWNFPGETAWGFLGETGSLPDCTASLVPCFYCLLKSGHSNTASPLHWHMCWCCYRQETVELLLLKLSSFYLLGASFPCAPSSHCPSLLQQCHSQSLQSKPEQTPQQRVHTSFYQLHGFLHYTSTFITYIILHFYHLLHYLSLQCIHHYIESHPWNISLQELPIYLP